MEREFVQVAVLLVPPVFVHAVTYQGIKTFDEYLAKCVVFVHIFTTFTAEGLGQHLFSILGRRHIRGLNKAFGINFFLHNDLTGSILLRQEVSYL